MKRILCNFLSALNQTVKKNKSSFNFIYFRQAPSLLRALIDTGYIQYYTRTGNTLTIHLRVSIEGPVLSSIKQKSKPSKIFFVRWKQLKKTSTLTLVLVDSQFMTLSEAIAEKKGGISLVEVI